MNIRTLTKLFSNSMGMLCFLTLFGFLFFLALLFAIDKAIFQFLCSQLEKFFCVIGY
jgi:hypothetical protein